MTHDAFKESWPVQPVFAYYLPAAVVALTLFTMLVGLILSKIIIQDPPDFINIASVGFGILDFATDYQVAYRLAINSTEKVAFHEVTRIVEKIA